MKLRVVTKGICEPNPGGDSACAVVIYEVDERGRERFLKQFAGYIGKGEGLTNYVVAYRVVIRALKHLRKYFQRDSAEIHCDLKTLVLRINGESETLDAEDHLAPLCAECRELLLDVPLARVVWSPKESVEAAGALARYVIAEQRKGAA